MAGRTTRGKHARICRTLRFQISRVMLEHDLTGDEVAFARDGFAERTQNGQRVSVVRSTCLGAVAHRRSRRSGCSQAFHPHANEIPAQHLPYTSWHSTPAFRKRRFKFTFLHIVRKFKNSFIGFPNCPAYLSNPLVTLDNLIF